jgi:hypothetical protein
MRAEVKADLAEALARLRAIAAAEPDLLADDRRLAERLYASWFHDPADGRERDWPAWGAFAAATALAELFEPGWVLAGWAEGGARLRRADGGEELAALGAFAPFAATAPLLPGMPGPRRHAMPSTPGRRRSRAMPTRWACSSRAGRARGRDEGAGARVAQSS